MVEGSGPTYLVSRKVALTLRMDKIATLALLVFTLVCLLAASAGAQVSVTTQNSDTERTAVYSNETQLTPTSTIHKLFTMPLDDPLRGQALILGGVNVSGFPTNILLATTSTNESAGTTSAFAFNADTGAQLWKLPLGTSAAFSTATPVLDPNLGPHGALFVVIKDSASNTNKLHAIDALAGTELPGSPLTISATFNGVGFNSPQENGRTALLDINGTIYIAFCHMTDSGTYHGWLIGYKYTTGSGFTQNGVWCDTCSGGNQGGIWQGGDGILYDGTHIFVSTGNGSIGGGNFAMNVVQLSPSALGTVESFYQPPNAASNSSVDRDLNGGGIVIMPGTGGKIFIGPTKYGAMYLINGADLPAAAIDTYGTSSTVGHSPIAWNSGSAQYAYVWPSGNAIQQYCYNSSTGSTGAACHTSSFSGGGTLALSSNPTGGNAMLWAYGGGELHAMNPTDVAAADYWNSNQSAGDSTGSGPGGFQYIAIANGKVYIPAGNSIIAYGTPGGGGGGCTTAPSTPGNLTATTASSSQINLSWSASTAASGCSVTYNVFESTTSGFAPSPSNQIASGVSGTTFSATGLKAATTYNYLVEASDAAGPSVASNQASATTNMVSTGTCGVICIDSGSTTGTSPWSADADFTGGATIDHANTINTSNVTNPAPQAVYQSARVTTTTGSGSFTYTIPGLTAGTNYLVRLHFAETFWTTAGSRTFNVSINGTQVLTNFDIFAAAGGENIANVQQFTEAANASGQFVITFTSVKDKALISGIEIDLTSTPRSCTTLCIDSGSTTGSTPFVADEDFTGGSTIDHANTINTSMVTNPAPAAVYQSARVGATQASGVGAPFTYTITGLTAGSSYMVRLHFCETFFTAKGSRVFNVSINGTQVLMNFDIIAASGGQNIANIQQFTATADTTGSITITFTSVTNNALISGIEID